MNGSIKNKIYADGWFISYNKSIGGEANYYAKIDYRLSDEMNTKSHRFASFEEAYQWIKNQVIL